MVEEEAARIEQEIEEYGGDDPHEPAPKKSSSIKVTPKDPNLVTWDGPNDPENPQNWSKGYKCTMTIVVIILAVNVYADIPQSI